MSKYNNTISQNLMDSNYNSFRLDQTMNNDNTNISFSKYKKNDISVHKNKSILNNSSNDIIKNTKKYNTNQSLKKNRQKILKDINKYCTRIDEIEEKKGTNINNKTINKFKDYNTETIKSKNEKNKIIKDNKCSPRLYTGLLDLACLSPYSLHITINNLTKRLAVKGITYIQVSHYIFRCTKNKIPFDIEICELYKGCYYYHLKFKLSIINKNHMIGIV